MKQIRKRRAQVHKEVSIGAISAIQEHCQDRSTIIARKIRYDIRIILIVVLALVLIVYIDIAAPLQTMYAQGTGRLNVSAGANGEFDGSSVYVDSAFGGIAALTCSARVG
jgi:hypothetical protein